MSKIRQKIKVGVFEVVIINMEAQGKVIVTVVDKKGKSLGQLRIGSDSGWFENEKIDLPINLN
jgi:IS30 family transposase